MRDYSVHLHPKQTLRINLLPIIAGVLLFLILTSIFLYFSQRKDGQTQLLSQKEEKKISLPFPKITSQRQLLEQIENILKESNGTYSVYIYDIKKKQGFGINEKMVITAASVNKIAILAALYYLAGMGEIDLEKTITLQKEDIQDYGTGSIRYDQPGTIYSLKTLARLMMEKSDNTAAYILSNHIIGLGKIQKLIDGWNLTQTNMVDNKTSNFDISILLIKMYQGEITNPSLTAEMLNFMDKSDFDDRIPAGVLEGIKVYHKTGDEIGKIHDVGIVDLPTGRPYYLGILTTDMTDDEVTKKTLARISQLVYAYMSNL